MLRRAVLLLTLLSVTGLMAACSTAPESESKPAQGAITNPPPKSALPEAPSAAVEAANTVSRWVELKAKGEPTDPVQAMNTGNPYAFSDIEGVKVLKYIDSTVETAHAQGILLKVNILIEPPGGGQQTQTYYAAVVREYGAWKVASISLQKP